MNAREEILSKISQTRQAKNQTISLSEEPVASGLKVPEGDLTLAFKNSIELVQGECIICESKEELDKALMQFISEEKLEDKLTYAPSIEAMAKQLDLKSIEDLSQIKAGITTCDLLVAQTGTAILTAKENRKILGLSPIHIIIAEKSQLRRTLDEATKEIAQKYGNGLPSQLTFITGPSRTADIEKTLILGAHGPKRLVVFIH